MPKNLAKTIHEAPQFSWLRWALASLAPCFFTNHLKLVNLIPGYFFGADISSEQLLFLRSSIFGTVTSSQQLFFSEYLLFRSKASTEQPLFENRKFFRAVTFRNSYFFSEWIVLKNSFFKASTTAQHQLFKKSYIFGKANFSERNIPYHLLFLVSYLFRAATFSKDVTFYSRKLPFQKSYFLTTYFFRGVTILQLPLHSYTHYLSVSN